MTLRVPFSRVLLSAALGGLCLLLCKPSTTAAPLALVDEAPAPRPAAAVDLDRKIIAEIKERSEIMKNLQYISDIIGPRLTGSKSAEKAKSKSGNFLSWKTSRPAPPSINTAKSPGSLPRTNNRRRVDSRSSHSTYQ